MPVTRTNAASASLSQQQDDIVVEQSRLSSNEHSAPPATEDYALSHIGLNSRAAQPSRIEIEPANSSSSNDGHAAETVVESYAADSPTSGFEIITRSRNDGSVRRFRNITIDSGRRNNAVNQSDPNGEAVVYPVIQIPSVRPMSQFSPVHSSPTSANHMFSAMGDAAAAAVNAAAVLATAPQLPMTLSPLQSASSGSNSNGVAPSSTRFRSKPVCSLVCRYCGSPVCNRGMKAILLADSGVELFSTDSPPPTVGFALEDYITEKCFCRIRDVACLSCGNQVGYHVTQPCKTCLSSCNNGHFWMFYKEHVKFSERMIRSGAKSVVWSELPTADKDVDILERKFENFSR